ncbi:MAG: hypothetical protein BGO29_05935 [Bacteroidales bacterium 36-12]|nr:MAG: hypothetical protein BGO29_05935 [Bacteroidales bacterium 36-12]
MIQIEDTIISFDLFDEHFVCDLNNCKGMCCVEGDAGAPLELEEIEEIKAVLPLIWDDLPKSSQEVILKQGVFYIDEEDEPVTSIVNGRECVFAYKDEHGIYKCAIEKAFNEGKTNFKKPISCHLYPVRVQKYDEFQAVNYHRWSLCNCAVKLGNKLKVPLYKFLKEPLIRRFGENWYEQLKIAAKELQSQT